MGRPNRRCRSQRHRGRRRCHLRHETVALISFCVLAYFSHETVALIIAFRILAYFSHETVAKQEMERIHREGGNAPIAENDDEQEKEKEKEEEIQQENEQLDDDNDDDQMEDVQVESMQPNVVNAFPIAEGAENEEQGRKEDENVGGGDEEQQYLFGNDEEMEVKVNDDGNNEDVEMEAVNEADDIVADIANVVATETDKNEDVDVNVDDAMPIAMNEEENMQM